MLGYRMPREPSTPRLVVWRRLRRLGVAQPVDGLAVLPQTPRTREALDWVAGRVLEAGGQATLWTATYAAPAQEHAVMEAMRASVAAEYAALACDADAAAGQAHAAQELAVLRRAPARLGRALAEVQSRDYFGAPGRREAERAVTALAAARRAPRQVAR